MREKILQNSLNYIMLLKANDIVCNKLRFAAKSFKFIITTERKSIYNGQ